MAFANKQHSSVETETSYEGEITPDFDVSPIKSAPEKKPETREQQPEREKAEPKESVHSGEEKESSLPATTVVPPKNDQPLVPVKEEEIVKIENIMEEGIGDLYMSMDDQHKQLLKAAGETTAFRISEQLGKAKVNVQRIFELIKNWLTMIPGVNKWFVVQESKIKTDKIIQLKKNK